jgi:micrococcal nuclease
MVQICKGKVITAKLTGETSHDRQVATCYCPEGRDIGGELVKQGLALDWALFSGGKYRHLEPQGIRRKMMYVCRRTLQETPLARNGNTRRNPG